MTKLEIFKEMIGESHSEFVAGSLKETYKDLQNELKLIEDVKNTDIFKSKLDEIEKKDLSSLKTPSFETFILYQSPDFKTLVVELSDGVRAEKLFLEDF